MGQEIKNFDVSELVLWTENPRDPISINASDQDIADKAWRDEKGKWKLEKLAKEMESHYDFSELPTVVIKKDKPIVYDGNRRIILAKFYYGLIDLPGFDKSIMPKFPRKIPCNLCTEGIAIHNIYRKHANSGSWTILDRDIFLHRLMGKAKTTLVKLEEATNLISTNPHLNQRFVRDEIFKEGKLKEMGFGFNENDGFESKHSKDESIQILEDIADKVKNKVITTRKNRGKIIEVLEKKSRDIIEKNKDKLYNGLKFEDFKPEFSETGKSPRKPRRVKKGENQLFGKTLPLIRGDVANLYRDIVDLNDFYQKDKNKLSESFAGLIRMSLRLLAETAAKEKKYKLQDYLISRYDEAKEKLDQDEKTSLYTQNVTKKNITNLLHIGAHTYTASSNYSQTMAISLILGEILKIDYERK